MSGTVGEGKPQEFISPENLGNNPQVVNYCRTFLSIIAGCVTGVLGFTGMYGFLCYLVLYATVSLALCARMKWDLNMYLPGTSVPNFLLECVSGQGMSFMLFWTLSYGLVHIY